MENTCHDYHLGELATCHDYDFIMFDLSNTYHVSALTRWRLDTGGRHFRCLRLLWDTRRTLERLSTKRHIYAHSCTKDQHCTLYARSIFPCPLSLRLTQPSSSSSTLHAVHLHSQLIRLNKVKKLNVPDRHSAYERPDAVCMHVDRMNGVTQSIPSNGKTACGWMGRWDDASCHKDAKRSHSVLVVWHQLLTLFVTIV